MKPMHIVLLMSLALGSASGSGPQVKPTQKNYREAAKQEDKAQKKSFKRHLNAERVECKHHPHTVACNDLKERQRIEKRQFKAKEKTAEAAEPR